LLVEGRLIVELKACRALAGEHTAQVLGYLKSAKMEDGLLVNFGSYKFEIKKYVMSNERIQGAQRLAGAASSISTALSALVGFICGRV
jgi:hypothetical protein